MYKHHKFREKILSHKGGKKPATDGNAHADSRPNPEVSAGRQAYQKKNNWSRLLRPRPLWQGPCNPQKTKKNAPQSFFPGEAFSPRNHLQFRPPFLAAPLENRAKVGREEKNV